MDTSRSDHTGSSSTGPAAGTAPNGSAALQPSPAERIRSACAVAHPAVLAVDGLDPITVSLFHLRGGDVFIGIEDDLHLPTGRDGRAVPAMLEVNDLSPLPLRERVRALVWLRGMLSEVIDGPQVAAEIAGENPLAALLDVGHTVRLLRLELASAVLADSSGAASVTPHALADAQADPFVEYEPAWLTHVERDHPELVDQLARRITARTAAALRSHRVRLLGIDRYGVRLRAEHHDHPDTDVRLPFAHPADDMASLQRGLRVLLGCPFLNGLRVR